MPGSFVVDILSDDSFPERGLLTLAPMTVGRTEVQLGKQ